MQNVVTAITGVFTAVGTWFASAVESIVPIFYSDTDGLTFLGTLTIMGLAISVIFLLLGVISNFMQFRS